MILSFYHLFYIFEPKIFRF